MSDFLIADLKATFTPHETEPNTTFAQFIVPESLPYFEGHFPATPMLPAFAIIEISLGLAKQLQWIEKINKVSSAKFLAAIKPNDQIKILLTKDKIGVDFEWQQLQGDEWKKASELSIE